MMKNKEGDRMSIGFIILAGGKSTRMKYPKHELIFNNQRMIDFIVNKAKVMTDKIYISANQTINGYTITHDQHKDIGPIEGIYQCMKYSDCDYYCVISCRHPLIPISIYQAMLKNIKDKECIVLRNNGQVEPLVSIFRKDVLTKIEKQIQERNYSVTDFCDSLDHTYYNSDLVLIGLKTQDDYQKLVKEYKKD